MSVDRGDWLGRYQLLSLLGTGGMAEVWRAKHVGPAGFARTVVVKRVLTHLAREATFVDMFLTEARLSARLTHPNIVQVHELGHEQGTYFMAMEYVEGCELGWWARHGGRLPIGCGVMIAQEVCRALAYAHTLRDDDGAPLGIVHRDVSPTNIMLGREGTVKLLDFGIAKALGASSGQRTETGILKGKLGYMSPEQVDGLAIDHRADLFAVGVVLHELLTGQRLFKGASDFITLTKMREADVERPSKTNPAVPPTLDEICMKALARNPDRRFASASEMADALAPFLDDWNAERMRVLVQHLLTERAREHAEIGSTVTEAPAHDDAMGRLSTVETAAKTVPRTVGRRRSWAWAALAAVLTVGGGLGVYAAVESKRKAEPAPPASASPVVMPVVAAPEAEATPTGEKRRPSEGEAAPSKTAPTATASSPVTAAPVRRTRPTKRVAPPRKAGAGSQTRPSTDSKSDTFDPESALP